MNRIFTKTICSAAYFTGESIFGNGLPRSLASKCFPPNSRNSRNSSRETPWASDRHLIRDIDIDIVRWEKGSSCFPLCFDLEMFIFSFHLFPWFFGDARRKIRPKTNPRSPLHARIPAKDAVKKGLTRGIWTCEKHFSVFTSHHRNDRTEGLASHGIAGFLRP